MSIRNAWLAAAILAAIAAPAAAQQTITKRANVAPDVTIEVSNVQGFVEVSAWDKNEVELVAELESDKDELEFEATPRMVRIEVDRPNSRYGRDQEDANLTLRVPRGARLVIDTVSADITVAGVRGEQDLESVSGDVGTQAFDAPVQTSAVSGDVTVTGTGGKAAVKTENVSGTATVTGVRGNFEGRGRERRDPRDRRGRRVPRRQFRLGRHHGQRRADARRAGRHGVRERHAHAERSSRP